MEMHHYLLRKTKRYDDDDYDDMFRNYPGCSTNFDNDTSDFLYCTTTAAAAAILSHKKEHGERVKISAVLLRNTDGLMDTKTGKKNSSSSDTGVSGRPIINFHNFTLVSYFLGHNFSKTFYF